MSTKRIAKLATATVASGFLTVGVLGATTVAAHADQPVDVTQDYNCDVTVYPTGSTSGPALGLGDYDVAVNIRGDLPESYTNGTIIPSRTIDVDLILPEDLRSATYNTVSGRSVEGSSDDTSLTLRNSGQEQQVPVQDLGSVSRSDIPAQVGTPWIVPAVGTVPAIPAAGLGPTQVLVPTDFTIDATIYKAAGSQAPTQIPSVVDCSIVDDSIGNRRGGVIQQGTATPSGAAPEASDVAVDTTPGTAVEVPLAANATDTDTTAALLGFQSTKPENGRLTPGKTPTYTPDEGFVGTDTFSYTVSDETGNLDTATVTVEVAKATSRTKVTAPKRSKAGKPVTMKVVVTSDPDAAGKVTAKLGAKTVATGKVRGGKATLTVPGKATKRLKGKKTFTVTYAGSATVAGSSGKAAVIFTK